MLLAENLSLTVVKISRQVTTFWTCFTFYKQNFRYEVKFLAVHNSSIGDLVCPLVGWLGTTNNQSLHNTTEWPKRLVTFETFDRTDFWTIFRFLKFFQIFGKISDFQKNSDFRKNFRFLEDFQIFRTFQIFGRQQQPQRQS